MKRFRLLITIFIGYALFFLFTFHFPYSYLVFCLGLAIGYVFHIVDRVAQLFLIPEFKHERDQFISFIKKFHLLKSIFFLIKHIPSATYSFYFLLLYFPLALYVITSTGSIVGSGIVLGLGLSFSAHFILGNEEPQLIQDMFFKPVKNISHSDVKKLMGGFIIAFCILSLIVIF